VIEIVEADITALDVDAVVNAANTRLVRGGGVDGAVHRAAGPELQEALDRIGGCPTGGAVRTAGFGMKARFLIHAVGPIWQGGGAGEEAALDSVYRQAFARALEEPGIRSIAFPAISTGIYGFPKEPAARIALRAMLDHEGAFDRIVACLFGADGVFLYRGVLASLTGSPR
jgi:O-acetyl-ADP-ribose deacetylase (regulator of RNase III)